MAAATGEEPAPQSQGDPAEAAAHHDEARAAVPSTSILTCWARALESRKQPPERLIYDPFAERLCGGKAPDASSMDGAAHSLDLLVDLMAVRTRWIDDAIAAAAPAQLVILGAGLDSRAWRLEAVRGLPVFEVDFPEVLDAKQALMEGEEPLAVRHRVPTNLAADEWPSKLVAAGLEPTRPSMWLLEGLTGYLTNAELDELFRRLTAEVAPGSSMLVTFVSSTSAATKMHRARFEDSVEVEQFLAKYGWTGMVFSFVAESARFRRAQNVPKDYRYFMASVALGPQASFCKQCRALHVPSAVV